MRHYKKGCLILYSVLRVNGQWNLPQGEKTWLIGAIMALKKKQQLTEAEGQERKQDAHKLAALIYDIYQNQKLKEKRDGQDKRQKLSGV